jgi:hypothetical protein
MTPPEVSEETAALDSLFAAANNLRDGAIRRH